MYVGERLRRIVARRRQTRRWLALGALIGCAAVPLAVSLFWKPPVLFVWNSSASAPIGLYRLHVEEPLRRGDMVAAWTPEPARTLAARRHYLPANVPLVKRVAAVAGDRVCAVGQAISINGRSVAVRKKRDSADRPMPWWNGCRLLGQDEVFLLMASGRSFDGRYFGVTRSGEVLGRAERLWVKSSKSSNNG